MDKDLWTSTITTQVLTVLVEARSGLKFPGATGGLQKIWRRWGVEMSYETWCMIYSAQYDFEAVQNVLGTHSQVTSKWKTNIGCAPHCHTTFNFSFSVQNVSGKSVDGPVFFPSLNRHHGCVLALWALPWCKWGEKGFGSWQGACSEREHVTWVCEWSFVKEVSPPKYFHIWFTVDFLKDDQLHPGIRLKKNPTP